jgi:hypothetical protein
MRFIVQTAARYTPGVDRQSLAASATARALPTQSTTAPRNSAVVLWFALMASPHPVLAITPERPRWLLSGGSRSRLHWFGGAGSGLCGGWLGRSRLRLLRLGWR